MRRPLSVAGLKDTIKGQWNSTLRRTATYDPPLEDFKEDDVDDTEAARVNGIRVWYSSFTSIDWLHDAVCYFSPGMDDKLIISLLDQRFTENATPSSSQIPQRSSL